MKPERRSDRALEPPAGLQVGFDRLHFAWRQVPVVKHNLGYDAVKTPGGVRDATNDEFVVMRGRNLPD